MIMSNGTQDSDARREVENVRKDATFSVLHLPREKWPHMSYLEIGDRVEIVGEIAGQFRSKIGVVTTTREVSPRRKFTVRLADGTESDFWDFQLQIPPIIFADMIVDTDVSLVPGLGGSTFTHQMRFISREFDIHLNLTESGNEKSLYGQLTANGIAPESSLITLQFQGEQCVTTATDSCGVFEVHQVPSGNAVLEILVPSRRIVVTFDVIPCLRPPQSMRTRTSPR